MITNNKIFLLGHKGFVGSGIAQFFNTNDINFTGIDRENYEKYKGQECDIFINAAGNSNKRLATKDPMADFQANVMSTLQTLLDFPCKKYILLSSIDVYPDCINPENNKENTTIDVQKLSNYGVSKFLAERLVKHYAKDWLIIRLGGMVGPNLKKNSVYDVIHYKKTFVSPKSEYQYIPTTEVAKIILELKNESKEIFNLCGDSTLVVEEIFKMANIDTKPELFDLRIEKYEVNIDKIKSKTQIPKTIDSVKQYVKDNQ